MPNVDLQYGIRVIMPPIPIGLALCCASVIPIHVRVVPLFPVHVVRFVLIRVPLVVVLVFLVVVPLMILIVILRVQVNRGQERNA